MRKSKTQYWDVFLFFTISFFAGVFTERFLYKAPIPKEPEKYDGCEIAFSHCEIDGVENLGDKLVITVPAKRLNIRDRQ